MLLQLSCSQVPKRKKTSYDRTSELKHEPFCLRNPLAIIGRHLLLVRSLLVVKDKEQGINVKLFKSCRRFEESWRRHLRVVGWRRVGILRSIVLWPIVNSEEHEHKRGDERLSDQHRDVNDFCGRSRSVAKDVQINYEKLNFCIPLRVCCLREKLEASFKHLNGKESNILGQGAFLGDLKTVCKVRQSRWETDLRLRGSKLLLLASSRLLNPRFLFSCKEMGHSRSLTLERRYKFLSHLCPSEGRITLRMLILM